MMEWTSDLILSGYRVLIVDLKMAAEGPFQKIRLSPLKDRYCGEPHHFKSEDISLSESTMYL